MTRCTCSDRGMCPEGERLALALESARTAQRRAGIAYGDARGHDKQRRYDAYADATAAVLDAEKRLRDHTNARSAR